MRKWLAIAGLVIVLDQLTKGWVASSLGYQAGITVLPFFSLVHVHNSGAAFSFLASAAGWQRFFFIGIGLAAAILIVRLLKHHAHEPLMAFAFALVLGGALGNVIDRVILGYVMDFLYFHYRQYGFPAFNIADSAITVGAALLIWDSLRSKPAVPMDAPR